MIGPSPFAHRATTSVLSDEGRRLFCRSGLYGEEYAFSAPSRRAVRVALRVRQLAS